MTTLARRVREHIGGWEHIGVDKPEKEKMSSLVKISMMKPDTNLSNGKQY